MDDVISLAAIDYLIIAVYMVGALLLGSYFGKYVKNAGDFFVGGKALPFWAIGMSVVVSDIGAMDFIAVSGETYSSGLAVANFDWMGSMPAMVFAAFIFIPYYWRSGVYTIPEFLGRRYNAAVQIIHAAIWGVFLLVSLSLMLWVTADDFMFTILGINPQLGVWVMVIVAGIYTFSGGLSAVVMTDAIQMIIMFVGGAALLILSVWAVGGFGQMHEEITSKPTRVVIEYAAEDPDGQAPGVTEAAVRAALEAQELEVLDITPVEMREETVLLPVTRFAADLGDNGAFVPGDNVETKTRVEDAAAEAGGDTGATIWTKIYYFKNHFKMLLPNDTQTAFPWTGIVFGLGLVMATAYMSGNQAVVQRTLGARSEWDAKGGMLFAGFLKSFIPLLVAVPGLTAILLAPELADLGESEKAVPTLIKTLLPPGLRGLMFAALLAALMSSVDSTLNSASTIWTTDLYGRAYQWTTGQFTSERHGLFVGRTFTVVFIIGAGVMAEQVGQAESVYNFLQTAMSMFQGPVLAILLLGIMWRRTTQWGGLAGLVLGVCFTTVLHNTEDLFPSEDPYLFIAWWSFVFSLIVTAVVSLVTPPEPDEKIRGLVFGQVMKDGEIQRVLGDRVNS